MENLSSNVTLDPFDEFEPAYFKLFLLIDIVPFLVGQPAIARLLWVTFTSKKATAILYINVALLLNLQYWIAIVHFIAMHLRSKIYLSVQMLYLAYAQIAGPMSLMCICVERYIAVMRPTSYPQLKRYRFRELCVVATWSFSVTIGFLHLRDFPTVSQTVLEHLPIYCLTAMIVIMVHSSVSIVRALKKGGLGRVTMHPAKKKAFKIVCATLYLVLICYAPVSVVQRIEFPKPTYDNVVLPLCFFFLSVASVVQPLYYLSTQCKITCFKREKKAK